MAFHDRFLDQKSSSCRKLSHVKYAFKYTQIILANRVGRSWSTWKEIIALKHVFPLWYYPDNPMVA